MKPLNTNQIPTVFQVRAADFAKQAVLIGQGAVVLYGSGSSAGGWFYRELVSGSKSYRTRRIGGAQTLEEAVLAATDVAFQLNSASAGSEAVLGGCSKAANRSRQAIRHFLSPHT